ncbi:hypothetical protein [Dysgonomonas sp. ZJ279]|uniref:hypothetical protein n=1 Tax=Dysgonomonas sp. ZJ279 TaxID=2709796 RepID=UPI0013EB2BD0|nr:hypothetical protein [Dysgonomonas sp. ZJ279]
MKKNDKATNVEFLFILSDYPVLESWYIEKYGNNKYIALKALVDVFNVENKYSIFKDDIIICEINSSITSTIYDIMPNLNAVLSEKIVSINRSVML